MRGNNKLVAVVPLSAKSNEQTGGSIGEFSGVERYF